MEPEDGEGPEFVQVRVLEEPSPPSGQLELVLGTGQRILVPSGFDEATLRRLVRVLGSC